MSPLTAEDVAYIRGLLDNTAAVSNFSFDVDGTTLRLAQTSLRHRGDGDLCYPVGRALLLALLDAAEVNLCPASESGGRR